MIFYILYRLGHFISSTMPLQASYALAVWIARLYYWCSPRDRESVRRNLRIIMHGADEKTIRTKAFDVFKNFAKYLVEFFRFSPIDDSFVKQRVVVEGQQYLDQSRKLGKGTIILSAHIGNWELGGFVVSCLGYPMSAVVLSHRHEKVNEFFLRQRSTANVRPIEIGMTLRSCFKVLQENGFLALVGDRDFSGRGIRMNFFGREALIPKGPAALSHRLGAPMVPSFFVRSRDGAFKLIFEKPIFPDPDEKEEAAIPALTERYLAVIESFVRKYPDQWYIFKDFWNAHGRLTII